MGKRYGIAGLILITACFFAGCQWSQAQTNESWKASEQTVERLSKNQPDFNYYEEKVPAYTFPELLKTGDGKKVSNQKAWVKVRRNEILELFRTEVFSRVPQTDYRTNFRVVNPYSWGTIAAWAWGASRCSSQGALCGLCQRRPLGRSARIIPCTLPFLTGFSAYRNRQQNT